MSVELFRGCAWNDSALMRIGKGRDRKGRDRSLLLLRFVSRLALNNACEEAGGDQ